VKDRGRVYNSNFYNVLETKNLLLLAKVLLTGAVLREESRGAHSRRDFTKRDDEKWLKHTMISLVDGELKVDYKPVTLGKWEPVERKY